jgi:hypothetical protein
VFCFEFAATCTGRAILKSSKNSDFVMEIYNILADSNVRKKLQAKFEIARPKTGMVHVDGSRIVAQAHH